MEKNVIQINGGITINACVTAKKRHACEKDYILNPAIFSCQNGKYLASIMDDSMITFDEIIESYDEETNFNEKKITCKTQNFYILVAFLLINKALLIDVTIN